MIKCFDVYNKAEEFGFNVASMSFFSSENPILVMVSLLGKLLHTELLLIMLLNLL